MPNWRNQLYLALALFVLGSAAYWLEFTHKPATEEKEERAKKVFDLKDRQIGSITVQGDGKSFELRCLDADKKQCKPGDNSRWELVAPIKTTADDSNANALVSSLNNLNPSETIPLKDESPEKRATLLKEYGLDPESQKTARKVTLSVDSEPVSIVLGATHPIGEGIFALRSAGGKIDETLVYVIPGFFKTTFDRDATYWRNKKLFDFAAADARSFRIEGSKGKIEGIKKDSDWSLSGPGEKDLAGDTESIEAFLSAVSYLTARDFVTEAKAKGAKPAGKITIDVAAPGSKEPKTFSLALSEIAGANPKDKGSRRLFAKASTQSELVELEPGAKERLDKGLKDLRQTKLISSLERYSVKRLEFWGGELGKEPLVIVSKDGKWSYEAGSPASKEVSGDKVQALLEKLSGNRVKEFLNQAGEEAKALHIVLGDEKNPKKRHFIFWKKGADLFAKDMSSSRKEILKVDPTIASELPTQRTQFDKAPSHGK